MNPAAATVSVRKLPRLTAFLVTVALAACSATAPRVRPGSAARIDRQRGGFTLTESVHVAADVRAEFSGAVQMLDSHRYNDGITQLLQVIHKSPHLVAVRVDLGMAYAKVGQLAKAQKNLKRAIALDPHQVVAYNELGMVLRRAGHFIQARASYQKALAIAPDFYYSRLNLAILCDLYLADRKCALDNYLAYQRLVPGDKRVVGWIRNLRSRRGH